MILNLFDQFASPSFIGIPLIFIAILVPWFLLISQNTRWLNNRLSTSQLWFMEKCTKEIFSPLSTPGHKWASVLVSLMLFLLMMNLLGLLPYTFTPTSQLSMNLGLAVPLWLATVITGMQKQMLPSLAHFLPEGTPTPLIPILIIIETISLFIRPLALGVRLTANLTAGHLLIHLTSMALLAVSSYSLSALVLGLLTLLTLLEIAVAMIQAYVFILLISLYLQENTNHHNPL